MYNNIPGVRLLALAHTRSASTCQRFHWSYLPGQQFLFEALRGFDDDVLVAAAPCIHELLRDGLPAARH